MPSATSVTTRCQKETAEIRGRQITVIDTPGLFDTEIDNKDIRKEIVKCVSMAAPGPHVFLLVLQIGRLTQEEMEAVKIIEKTFGATSNMYTIILFTRADDLKTIQIEQYIEDAGRNLKTLLFNCGNRYHMFNNGDKYKIDSMVKANKGSCFTNDMFQEVENVLEEKKEKILKEREEQTERENEDLKKKHEAELEKMSREMQKLKERQAAEQGKEEEQFKHREEQMKREKAEMEQKLREDFEKRREEDDLKMKRWLQEINREREENRKRWERKRRRSETERAGGNGQKEEGRGMERATKRGEREV
ncbi:GTPase IMAP family member 4 [Bagarius yarrelli]|uniref:GTPase IMAP family member 4 n=1 Tax=Bagarius yarrelli TaxID=175774 RepID=A0A556VV61_BAGYA|nr:GTPase IMAP family member 4 [Bagarius yarrelli]